MRGIENAVKSDAELEGVDDAVSTNNTHDNISAATESDDELQCVDELELFEKSTERATMIFKKVLEVDADVDWKMFRCAFHRMQVYVALHMYCSPHRCLLSTLTKSILLFLPFNEFKLEIYIRMPRRNIFVSV